MSEYLTERTIRKDALNLEDLYLLWPGDILEYKYHNFNTISHFEFNHILDDKSPRLVGETLCITGESYNSSYYLADAGMIPSFVDDDGNDRWSPFNYFIRPEYLKGREVTYEYLASVLFGFDDNCLGHKTSLDKTPLDKLKRACLDRITRLPTT